MRQVFAVIPNRRAAWLSREGKKEKEEGRRKKEEGRRKKEEGRASLHGG
jgi:hypothetical protein